MNDRKKTRGLGRGLSALMADVGQDDAVQSSAAATPRRPDMYVPIEQVAPNPDQPRRSFTPEHLEELAASIREKGIIQPLIVREKVQGEQRYEIVAGERRWRAAQMAQLHEIPVLVREFDDTEVLEVAIIENIQRADLNPVEEAAGYRQLMDRFGHTQEKLAEALGKSRSHIANLLRLLHLPEEVQTFLREGKLSMGHARALITSEDPGAVARKVIQGGLSVRETERLAKGASEAAGGATRAPKAPAALEKDADTRALEGDLSAATGLKISIDHAGGGESGQVVIRYANLEELDEICRMLSAAR
ncbi:ParB/RepB/Spo0J family partition protein [Pseudooceanicola sp. 216_PA32_1]|uniref:ParB/RepB/Spo0J family partition protein n=1 Tax=Pseudooceanicola pacificus TaxID=2676438 RepID=A0A844W291_9RHOB|nr:ParB/RepB/Spo0J family partition protein [Pseudooceanicola pacificus]MWB76941.1 ParB/RepB/Spo0J family partition protein [Pseudooceanicola pacificus]